MGFWSWFLGTDEKKRASTRTDAGDLARRLREEAAAPPPRARPVAPPPAGKSRLPPVRRTGGEDKARHIVQDWLKEED